MYLKRNIDEIMCKMQKIALFYRHPTPARFSTSHQRTTLWSPDLETVSHRGRPPKKSTLVIHQYTKNRSPPVGDRIICILRPSDLDRLRWEFRARAVMISLRAFAASRESFAQLLAKLRHMPSKPPVSTWISTSTSHRRQQAIRTHTHLY